MQLCLSHGSSDNPIGWPSDPNAQVLAIMILNIDGSSDRMAIRSDDHLILSTTYSESFRERASDWDKSHNVCCILDAHYTDTTPFKVMAKFLRESKINKALIDRTIVYESHFRMFWKSVRYDEKEKMIYSVVQKKDKNDQDVDIEVKFNVGDLRHVLERFVVHNGFYRTCEKKKREIS
ncbi:hypothetical protein Hanom_Chr06g00536951 [Helianthus anomalus]